jgi:molybdopterin molybdotransferase
VIPLSEARQFVLSSCRPLGSARVALAESPGHVLAETIRAGENVPPFANSAMDGYAVRSADTSGAPVRLRVVDTIMAGDNPTVPVGRGEAARIMTGAPMPPGADAVSMVEHTEPAGDGGVVICREVERDTHVRRAGDDVAAGDEVFATGTPISAAHVGVLASLGVESVLVHRRPRVGVISTGDELVVGAGALAPGKIRDSNRPSLLAQLESDGWESMDLGRIADDEGDLTEAFESGAARCDALVTSGGVSVGDRDLVKVVLEKLSEGTTRWLQIAIRPAKPFAFGTLGPKATPVFGLPGNPVSALVSYELLVRPALRAMAGFPNTDRPLLTAVADRDLPRRPDGKVHFARVLATADSDGSLHVRASGAQDSHILSAMADANALAVLPDGGGVRAGDHVEVLLLDAGRAAEVGGRW